MKKLFAIIFVCFIFVGNVFADDNLPQLYTPNNINPYKTNKWLNLFSLNNAEKPLWDDDYSKYDYMLSRIEKEWFNKDFTDLSMAERLNRLEEHVFGTSFDEAVDKRCDRLKRAFNAQKQTFNKDKSLFSGVPTSIPFGVEELVGR